MVFSRLLMYDKIVHNTVEMSSIDDLHKPKRLVQKNRRPLYKQSQSLEASGGFASEVVIFFSSNVRRCMQLDLGNWTLAKAKRKVQHADPPKICLFVCFLLACLPDCLFWSGHWKQFTLEQ